MSGGHGTFLYRAFIRGEENWYCLLSAFSCLLCAACCLPSAVCCQLSAVYAVCCLSGGD
jgi:hypothetical protein